VILRERLVDESFLAARVDGRDDYARHVAAWTPERAAATCGIAVEAIVAAARLYGGTRPALAFHGLGLTEQRQGTEGVMALVDLALLTGNLGRPGAGINPLRGQNNVQGAAIMGCEPASLTGGAAIEVARARHEALWGVALPTTPGLDVLGMIDAAAAGTLKALYVIGYDLAPTLANAGATARALARLELVVVQDLFLNQTALAHGHVFLPAQSSFEKEGTFMNAERRVQRVRRALSPRGAARSDAEAIGALAAALGHGRHFDHAGPEAVWDEVRALWPAVAGMSYARLDAAGLQWPCRDVDDPGSTILHREAFAHGPRARLACIDPEPAAEAPDAGYPFLLMTGRHLQQFNAGTMTGRTAQQQLRPTDTLDIAPADAARLGLADGVEIRVESRHGACVLPCRVDPGVKPGELFASFHDPARWLNRVTGSVRDRHTSTPAYKLTAVRLAPATAGALKPAVG
jgi:formate dehydrogenase major subunit